jgi:predicted SAM-dependent methyltransferase
MALTTSGLREAFSDLMLEFQLCRTHWRGVRQARRISPGGLKLHLGSGPNRKQGWINIDLHQAADLALDLREPLPFRDGSCAMVYSEHVLEHFEYPEPVMSMLRDWRRVLAPGGTCRVGVPDTGWPLAEYAGLSRRNYFAMAKERWHPDWCQTPLEHINYHFRQGREHHFAYDAETLIGAMTRAGFINASVVSFDPQIDSAAREVGTLYVSAMRP